MKLISLPASLALCLLALPWTFGPEAGAAELAEKPAEKPAGELAAELVKARKPADRDEAFEALRDLADEDADAEALLVGALTARWEAASDKLESSKLDKKFARLLSQRKELDELRSHALSLIEDEETYFYPYTQPNVSAKKAAEYHKVKGEVLNRVATLEKFWKKSGKAKLPKSAAASLEEISWLRSHQSLVPSGFSLPSAVPAWAELLPLDLKDITLASFPLDAEEAARMQRDRKVSLYNERVWEECVSPKRPKTEEDKKLQARFPSDPEREQVRVTNAYRSMFGRPSLTWNPLLQEAAHHHSDYQTRTGEFGHYQKDPETRTPFDRMALAGYRGAKSENCAKGATDPAGAHANWTGSSGHHRNILMQGHKQMASAVSGDIWTQNYGINDSAEKDL